MAEQTFKYFSAVAGRAVQRHGTRAFIGCDRGPGGFVWDEQLVARIPLEEWERNFAAYRQSVLFGDLLERTEADYRAWELAQLPAEPPAEVAAAAPLDPLETEGPQGPAPKGKPRRASKP